MTPEPEWVAQYPELADWLMAQTDDACQHLDDAPDRLAQQVAQWVPGLGHYQALVQLPVLSPSTDDVPAATLPEIRAIDMPGRKRLQAGAFTSCLLPLSQPALDWCCGKGHLSRTLAPQCPGPVRGLEWNAELVRDGNRLAGQFGDRVSIHCQDVMAADLALPADHHGVALHACGDLHRQLFRRGASAGLPRLSVSPCCYHLTASRHYRPLSDQASGHEPALELTANELRLAVQETVTAPARVREQTRLVSQWRLGFDGLQRVLREQDAYLPVPSHPPRLANEDFEAFCRWAAAKKGLRLPAGLDFRHWQAFGERRFEQVRRYELVRHLFRRPLELWMVLDYAVYLEERGYRVTLGTFCDRSLTPRNLLLDAVRACDTPPARHSHP